MRTSIKSIFGLSAAGAILAIVHLASADTVGAWGSWHEGDSSTGDGLCTMSGTLSTGHGTIDDLYPDTVAAYCDDANNKQNCGSGCDFQYQVMGQACNDSLTDCTATSYTNGASVDTEASDHVNLQRVRCRMQQLTFPC